jgi:hypothetical protein
MPHQGDEDWELWLRLVRAGHRGSIIPETLFYYRRRRGSMSEACTSGETHLDLVRYIVRKHGEAYRESLHEVLLAKEDVISDLMRSNDRLEREIHSRRQELERRLRELDVVRRRLGNGGQLPSRQGSNAASGPGESTNEEPSVGLEFDHAALAAEYRRAVGEVRALRSSWSWRLTAPLRAAYDLLSAGRRRKR